MAIEEAQEPSFLGIPFLDLRSHHCRYPRTIKGKTMYCGQPRIEDSSYCLACHKLCHIKPGKVRLPQGWT